MIIGTMAGTLARSTLSETFDAIIKHGIHHIQFSFACAGLGETPESIDQKLCDSIRKDMELRGIIMSALSGTFNMIDPDLQKRKESLRRFRLMASVCHSLGTSVITLCTGTRDPLSMWRRHPDNDLPDAWDDLVASMGEALEAAEKYNVDLAFEPEVSNVIDSAIKARRLIDQIGSSHLKVVMDPANIFHKGELPKMREMITEAFDLLGKDIALAHAKDLDHDGDAGHLPAGKGLLDYKLYLSLMEKFAPDIPLILHGLTEAELDWCIRFLESSSNMSESKKS